MSRHPVSTLRWKGLHIDQHSTCPIRAVAILSSWIRSCHLCGCGLGLPQVRLTPDV